jgi:sugar fermentation stimulation protein A
MRYSPPLVAGKLVKRYKRFLADVELNSEIVVAHCPNPGSMLGLAEPGTPVWLSPRTAPRTAPGRKLDWVWELSQLGRHYVGINTMHPNRLVSEAITAGEIPELAGYDGLRREVPYGHNSRVDMVLSHPGKPPCYVEVKNVHLRRGGPAEFPDSVTKRGTKHLAELAQVAAGGGRAVIFFAVQRNDCERFSLAADIDPAFAAGFRQALKRGVEALCYAWTATPDGLALTRRLPIADTPKGR